MPCLDQNVRPTTNSLQTPRTSYAHAQMFQFHVRNCIVFPLHAVATVRGRTNALAKTRHKKSTLELVKL